MHTVTEEYSRFVSDKHVDDHSFIYQRFIDILLSYFDGSTYGELINPISGLLRVILLLIAFYYIHKWIHKFPKEVKEEEQEDEEEEDTEPDTEPEPELEPEERKIYEFRPRERRKRKERSTIQYNETATNKSTIPLYKCLK